MDLFTGKIPINDSKKMKEFQELMNKIQDETIKNIQKLAKELNISEKCAGDVFYLRTRSRWTQELEDNLINLHKNGNPPDICDYGH